MSKGRDEPITSVEQLQAALKNDTKVKVAGVDVDGVLRGKIMSKAKFLSVCQASPPAFGFCSVIFGWDLHDRNYDKELKISNKSNGYKDITARIDFSTFRRIPWEDNLPLFLCTFLDESGKTLYACPRGLLQTVLDQLQSDLGYTALAGAEYEYFQFKETPHSIHQKGFTDLDKLTPGMHGYSLLRTGLNADYFHSIYDQCERFGIDIEGHHTETGPGVFETALGYQDALRMADNACLFKLAAKSIGLQHGIMPSFMAKPHNNLPGCSGHVHVSLKGKTGKNMFASRVERKDAKWPDLRYCSQDLEHFLAGVLAGLPDVMPCLVPTINGYKRLVENFWAPVNVSWGYESRLASVRIISPPLAPDTATRIEVRVPGADMNPFFTIAAIIGLGLYGIKHKLPLDMPPISAAADDPSASRRLPKNLYEATKAMAAPDSYARKIFGDDFVDHFAATRENEWELFSQSVTSWELERYLELA